MSHYSLHIRHTSLAAIVAPMDYTVPDQITTKVFLGKSNSAINLETLQRLRITHILMVGHDLEAHFPRILTYKHIPLDDKEGAPIAAHFDEAFEFIDAVKFGGNVLVHCQAGVSRSAAIVIAYIMRKYGRTFNEAFAVCKLGRPCINPNRGFVAALRAYRPAS